MINRSVHLNQTIRVAMIMSATWQRLTIWEFPLDFPAEALNSSPKPGSYDSWRKALGKHFRSSEVGSHSFRKGRARWLKLVAKFPEDVVQSQGGLCSTEVMRRIYTKVTEDDRRELIVKCCNLSVLSLETS